MTKPIQHLFFLCAALILLMTPLFAQSRSSSPVTRDDAPVPASVYEIREDTSVAVIENDEAINRMARELQQKTALIVGPEDILDISVRNHPELSVVVIVDPWGFIEIPSLGKLDVRGLTEDEVERELRDVYLEFLENPRIDVTIKEFNSRVFYVLGEVKLPGKYPMGGKFVTLRDAIVMSGLPTTRAAEWRVFIISQSKNGPTYKHINLYKVLNRGDLERNVILQPGDIVYVPMTILDKIATFIGRLVSPLVGLATRLVP